jgi:hypothetical protein
VVRLVRAVRSAFQRNMVKGRVHYIIVSGYLHKQNRMRTHNFTFSTMVLLEHLNVRIVGKAVLADGREVSGLPARPV